MAKNDKKKHQAQIDTQETNFNAPMNAIRGNLDTTQNAFMNNYNTGTGKNMGSYDDIMQGYKNVLDDSRSGRNYGGRPGYGGSTYTPQTIALGPDPFNSYGGLTEFSKTGGLSEAEQGNMRERAIAPTRAIYQSGLRNIQRQKALQGGYSPNATAAIAKTTRDSSQAAADANIGANAEIAKMVQQGKMFGLSGMGNIEGQRYGMDADVKKFNAGQQNWAEENRGLDNRFGAQLNAANYRDPYADQLAALNGMTGLYGTTPAMAQLFGQQVLQNQGQMLQGQGLQGEWGQNQIGNQLQNSQIKGNFGQFMDNVGSAISPLASVGGALTGIGNIWNPMTKQKSPMLPSGPGYGTYMDPSRFGQTVPVGGRY